MDRRSGFVWAATLPHSADVSLRLIYRQFILCLMIELFLGQWTRDRVYYRHTLSAVQLAGLAKQVKYSALTFIFV